MELEHFLPHPYCWLACIEFWVKYDTKTWISDRLLTKVFLAKAEAPDWALLRSNETWEKDVIAFNWWCDRNG